jgi:hypothetical protein
MSAKDNILQLLGLPSEFGILLLILSLILTLAPYLAGNDFGLMKIPNFDDSIKRKLKYIGPLSLLLVFSLHFNYKVMWSKNDRDKIIVGDMYTVHMYNVDDIAELHINEKAHYKVQWGYQGYEPGWFPFVEFGKALINSKPGDSQVINITSDLQPGDNTLRFTLWDSGIYPGAASLFISVKKNGQELIGESFSVPHYTTPKNQGLVYERTFHIQY